MCGPGLSVGHAPGFRASPSVPFRAPVSPCRDTQADHFHSPASRALATSASTAFAVRVMGDVVP